jgi:hypothetical protein
VLEDVPAGSYTLKCWHEKLGMLERQVTVEPAASATAIFEYK